MREFKRYAVYAAPEDGPLAQFAAEWLGWDAVSGKFVDFPALSALPRAVRELTETPRKYGFHGTLKPPFRLATGSDFASLTEALDGLAARTSPVTLDRLALHRLGGFVALTPVGDVSALESLAASCVRDLDGFRAPAPEAELARRRAAGLSDRQELYLTEWGYPYVMEEFRFHFTLTGKLTEAEAEEVVTALNPALTPLIPQPFVIGDLCLFGEDEDGRFHLVSRHALTG